MTKTMQRNCVCLTKLAPKLTYATIFLAFAMSPIGCAMNADKEQRAGQAAGAQKAAPATSAKESNVPGLALNLQELSVREERGQTTFLVKFSQPVTQYRHFPLPQPSRIVLDIFTDAKQPSKVETFRIDTHWVGTLRLSSSEGSVRLVTDIAAATVPPYTITPEEGGLNIVIGSIDANATAKKDVTLVKAGMRTDIRAGEKSAQGAARASAVDQVPADEKQYTGQKISLDFKDADIKNVFRLLAEVSGLNIVVTADVNRRVTLRLVEIPWDQALALIIDTNGLAKEQIGNVVRISTAGTLKSEKDALFAAKRAQDSVEDVQTAFLTVNYAKVKDLVDKVLDKIKVTLSPRGVIVPDERSNTIVVRDIKKGVDDAIAIISRLDVRTPQVLIESNLIETTPTFARSLGIDMATRFNGGRVASDTRFTAESPFSGPRATFFENATPVITPASGFAFAYLGNNVASLLTAAEAEGNVKIISRPSVVTLNNVESQIESANVIRIRTTAATVGEAGAIREIRAGITLKVTPQVSADGFVLLNIAAKSSTLDFGRTVDDIPQENTREAKANVLVRDGETVVIGGIMKDTSSNSDTGIPYLKDVPVLGWLFKRSTWRKDFEELVVFITPRVLSAGSENLPTAEQMWRDQLKQTEGTASAKTPLKP